MRTRIEQDFTQNKEEVLAAINHLYFPGFNESNVFDALLETTDRLKDVKGKKSIVILASGVDTFFETQSRPDHEAASPIRRDDICIGLGEFLITRSPNMGSLREMDYLQAQNQLKTSRRKPAVMPGFRGSKAKCRKFSERSRLSCGTSTASLIHPAIACAMENFAK